MGILLACLVQRICASFRASELYGMFVTRPALVLAALHRVYAQQPLRVVSPWLTAQFVLSSFLPACKPVMILYVKLHACSWNC